MNTKLPYRGGSPLRRHQQPDGTSPTLLGGQHKDQDFKLQAVMMKPLKESQVGDNPLYHPVEVSFSDFKSSSDSSSFSKLPFLLFFLLN